LTAAANDPEYPSALPFPLRVISPVWSVHETPSFEVSTRKLTAS